MHPDMHLHIIAGLLRRGHALDQLSTGLTLLSVVLGLVPLWINTPALPVAMLAACLMLLGLVEKYYALRVAFDAELFQTLASDTTHLTANTRALDQALTGLGLQPAGKAGRPWAERSQGALKLLRQQVLFVALQCVLLLGTLLIYPWLAMFH
ncbi:hypothetical protein [uncultured Pseudomonas sp.]|uniref:hypothetical protein n=1 Tax=uncultured Pseudomonas sp. TaxID=114707 RepID=UPI0025F8D35D|nr:hypothetical protein [uncultured Pseudomonas sp.]